MGELESMLRQARDKSLDCVEDADVAQRGFIILGSDVRQPTAEPGGKCRRLCLVAKLWPCIDYCRVRLFQALVVEFVQ